MKTFMFISLLSFTCCVGFCPPSCVCSTGVINVECVSHAHTTLPKNLPKDTKSLVIRYNQLSVINNSVFKMVPQLDKLSLIGGNISIIKPSIFQNLHKIRRLHLEISTLKNIEDFSFANLSTLNELEIISSQIQNVSMRMLAGLTNLQKFIFSSKSLQHVERNVFSNTRTLLVIEIYNSSLSEIDKKTFNGLQELQYVNLERNRLVNIENGTFSNLPRLYQLNLKENSLQSIQSHSFTNLPSIRRLQLGVNPELKNLLFLQQLTNLRSLDISQVNLSSIETTLHCPQRLYELNMTLSLLPASSIDFSQCSNLKELDIHENDLSTFYGDEFNTLINLEVLHLHKTKINRLRLRLGNLIYLDLKESKGLILDNDSFTFLPSLIHLDLRKINLTSVPKLSNMKFLSRLMLSENQISFINSSIGNFLNLKHLWLHSNGLRNISKRAFSELSNLIKLDLSNNRLSSKGLADGFLRSCNKLSLLDLSRNELENLRNDHLTGIENSLKILHLDRNPFTCDCHAKYLTNSISISNQTGYCFNPPWVKKIQISDFKNLVEPCLNNGSCMRHSIYSTITNTCKCLSDFTGEYCENAFLTCSTDTCENNGTCTVKDSKVHCICKKNFTGKHCQKKISLCKKDICLNDGVCLENGTTSNVTCNCSSNFAGFRCEKKLLCSTCANRNERFGYTMHVALTFGLLVPSTIIAVIVFICRPKIRKINTIQTDSQESGYDVDRR